MVILVLIPCLKIKCGNFIMLMHHNLTVTHPQKWFLQAIYDSQSHSYKVVSVCEREGGREGSCGVTMEIIVFWDVVLYNLVDCY
jgi:hypothetical protein